MRRSRFFAVLVPDEGVIALLSAVFAAQAATLQIIVHGVRDAMGTLRANVYAGPEGFPKDHQAMYTASQPATPATNVDVARFTQWPLCRRCLP